MRVFSFRAWHKDEKRMCKVKSFGEKFLLLENCEYGGKTKWLK